jgi:hypothetical protein
MHRRINTGDSNRWGILFYSDSQQVGHKYNKYLNEFSAYVGAHHGGLQERARQRGGNDQLAQVARHTTISNITCGLDKEED